MKTEFCLWKFGSDNRPDRPAGFSLLEMMVTLAILGLMATISFSGLARQEEKSSLADSANLMVSNIKMAQNMTMGSSLFNGSMPANGWGIRFNQQISDNTSYILFADADSAGTDFVFDGASEQWREIELPEGVVVSGLDLDGTPETVCDIVFEPPDPTVLVDGIAVDETTITLTDQFGQTKNVVVNRWGLVEIENIP